MNLLQQPLEKKLSSLLGRAVTFAQFKTSLVGGSAEAWGMTVAGTSASEPLLTVKHIRAEVSIAKALTGQIFLKSLDIEGVELHVARQADGRTNLPARPTAASASAGVPTPPLRIVAQDVRVNDVQARYSDATSGLTVAAKGIVGQLRQTGGGIEITAGVESVGRVGDPAGLGPMTLGVTFAGATDLAQLLTTPVSVTGSVAGGLNLTGQSSRLDGGQISLGAMGNLDIAPLRPWLAQLAPGVVVNRPIELRAKVQADRARGIHIDELEIRLADVDLGRGTGPSQSRGATSTA